MSADPVPAGAEERHPLAGRALFLGVLSIVFGALCGLGGAVGILAITNGLEVRQFADAEPGRWTGRDAATAGIVTGIVGLAVGLAVTVIVVVVVATGRTP